MWWGGGGGGGSEGALPDGSGSGQAPQEQPDVLEILSEEDLILEEAEGGGGSSTPTTSSPIHVPSSVEEAELRDLKEQFMAQENLLGQLKGVLRSNEEKLQTKEKEVHVRFHIISHCQV